MKKWLWIVLLVGLLACSSSSTEEGSDTGSSSDTNTTSSDTDEDTSDPKTPSDATGASDGEAIAPPDKGPDAKTPPGDGGGFPLDECWSPEEVVSTMDCDAICTNTLQCDPDDECEMMCPLTGKYIAEPVGTALTECMTKPCGEFPNTDFFQTCAQEIMVQDAFPGVSEGKTVCDEGMNALVSCPTVDSQIPPLFHQGCMMVVPLFSAEAQAKIAACTEDPCTFLDCLTEANCFLAQMLMEMSDDGGGPPPPGPGPSEMCWMPDEPEGGYNLDCESFCDKANTCTDMPPGECEMICVSNAAYINENAGPLLNECLAAGECTQEMGMGILPMCLAEVAGSPSGALTTPAEGQSICDKLSMAISGCPNMADFEPLFEASCKHLATLATSETMEQLAPCSDLKCDATMQCVTENNCLFMTLLAASMMMPPEPPSNP